MSNGGYVPITQNVLVGTQPCTMHSYFEPVGYVYSGGLMSLKPS